MEPLHDGLGDFSRVPFFLAVKHKFDLLACAGRNERGDHFKVGAVFGDATVKQIDFLAGPSFA